jgi:hypothetical protein
MAYETFERRAVRVDDLTMAFDPSGRIALNSASSRALLEAGVKAVRILWDKETRGIALQAARKGDMNAYSIAFGGGSRSSTVSAKAFLRYIGWSPTRRQIVPATWNAQTKMLEATLPSGFVGGRGKKENIQEANSGR